MCLGFVFLVGEWEGVCEDLEKIEDKGEGERYGGCWCVGGGRGILLGVDFYGGGDEFFFYFLVK